MDRLEGAGGVLSHTWNWLRQRPRMLFEFSRLRAYELIVFTALILTTLSPYQE